MHWTRHLLRILAGNLAVSQITDLPKTIVPLLLLARFATSMTNSAYRRMSMEDIPSEVGEITY